ncbi:MAG: hypothetical protein DLM69_09360 [Candidatus Chloroheliales bacterium]|nr:MAG: hypothetical protein DLM69_09360 [Chloroflexota bacterium]
MKSISWHEACHRRLTRNYLLAPAASGQLVDVVSEVGGIQAQVITAAELDVGVRVADVTQEQVRTEIWQRRNLVKTYGPRETLHLLPAVELPMWMAAMRARAALHETHPYASAGLNSAQSKAVLIAIGEALDGRALSREELAFEVGRRAGDWAKELMASTWGSFLRPAAYAGLLCFGPSQGSRVTFVRADQWVGNWQEIEPAQALADVCRRYFAAYGPATHTDFGHWFALKPGEARQVMDSLGDELAEVKLENRRAWVLAADAKDFSEHSQESLRLLPQYDCYIIGSPQRERVVPATTKAHVLTYKRGRYEGATGLPVLLIDGVVAGLWERRQRGKRGELKVEAFAPLTASQREQLEAEVARIGRFLGSEATLSLGTLD